MTSDRLRRKSAAEPPFAEAAAWRVVGAGWRPVFGSFAELGFSFEWHDFTCKQPLDWARSFHPGGVELCLNLNGRAVISDRQQLSELNAQSCAFYRQGDPPLTATRHPGERHRFITVEYAPDFLRRHFTGHGDNLHALVGRALEDAPATSGVTAPERLNMTLLGVVETLQHPPVLARAQSLWFQSKALELAAHLFFCSREGELFCTRAQRAARDRVERVRVILRKRLSDPPSLEELGKAVGCSPFYLSRLFSQEAGMTIQQFVRQSRLERAAELLRTGQCNVTEAALEVGYNSLSHFSSAFHSMFGCCPGLYPLKTPTQQAGTNEEI
jgi:AraC-like DNA-binding protein